MSATALVLGHPHRHASPAGIVEAENGEQSTEAHQDDRHRVVVQGFPLFRLPILRSEILAQKVKISSTYETGDMSVKPGRWHNGYIENTDEMGI